MIWMIEGPSPALIPGRGLLFRFPWVHALSAREQMSLVVFASVAFFPYCFVRFQDLISLSATMTAMMTIRTTRTMSRMSVRDMSSDPLLTTICPLPATGSVP